MEKEKRPLWRWLRTGFCTLLVVACLVVTTGLLVVVMFGGAGTAAPRKVSVQLDLMERFDLYMTNVKGEALEGIQAVKKIYWLRDTDMVAPEPNPDGYGEAEDPAELKAVLESARELLDGQQLIFTTDTQITKDSKIKYYLDETILAITWQHNDGRTVYTCSEVKIAHPSQFRRFLSDGEYGSGKLYLASEMAASVNAVTATNGDYYAFRGYGNHVYNGEVKSWDNRYLDTCYIDADGDLLMVDYGKVVTKEQNEAFVAEHDIRFSLAFGPILLRDGKRVEKFFYAIGETDGLYSRAALCQQGSLHYLLVTANRKGQNVSQFAKHLEQMGVQNAYMLDGGQTAAIITGDELMNRVDYGGERKTSDIIYFATALPDGG